MARLLLNPIGGPIDTLLGKGDRERNRGAIQPLEDAIREKRDITHAGWGERATARVHQKGKLTTWERIDLLRDPGTAVREVGTLVNWGRSFDGSGRDAPGAGVVTCFARVQDRWCIVIANENTVASGAWWPMTPEKIERAQQMAMKLRLPLIYLVDCSGLFLPEQSASFSGRTGAGHIFTLNSRLADAGVPQIAGVFGDCIAGGGYMPIISDRVYMTEGAYMVIAGAALIKGAKSQQLTSLDIGGPEVHVHQSGCADTRVPDDRTAIAMIRSDVADLPSSAVNFYRHGVAPVPPSYDPMEIAELFPPDFRQVYEIEEVIARLVDQSLFHEVLPGVGREIVTGLARVSGLWVGIVANRQGIIDEPGVGKRPGGALYREGIAKITSFTRSCSDDGIPLLWLQDISGFDIGDQAEALGLLGYGSSLIYANSTPRHPVFTVLLRKASGAGYYAMSGMPYEPIVQLSSPISRLAVMEGSTLAIATFNPHLNDDFEVASDDPEERATIEAGMAKVENRIQQDMDPVRAASTMDTDEVIAFSELRGWLECLVESAWQSAGYRRTKNPRIWTMHDLARLAAPAGGEARVAGANSEGFTLPTAGTWIPAHTGAFEAIPGEALGQLLQAGVAFTVTFPEGASGLIRPTPGGRRWLECDSLIAIPVDGLVAEGKSAAKDEGADVLPEGVVEVRADTDGTVYLCPEPGSAAFVSLGEAVAERVTLALIEVMKTFTPVRSEGPGVVERVLVSDGEAVSAGQPLLWLRK
jgi:3-methylcrotonyl-CoA carboxylase beta subunit